MHLQPIEHRLRTRRRRRQGGRRRRSSRRLLRRRHLGAHMYEDSVGGPTDAVVDTVCESAGAHAACVIRTAEHGRAQQADAAHAGAGDDAD